MLRRSITLALTFTLAALAAAAAPKAPWLETSVHPDRTAAARGEEFRLAVVLAIDEGYHLNANPPSADFQVPTEVKPESHPAVAWGAVRYPAGHALAAEWTEGEAIQVYEGRTVLVVRGTVADDAPLGETTVRLALRYQGCTDKACFQPVTRTLGTTFEVVEAGAETAPANQDVFAEAEEGTSELAAAFERNVLLYLGLLVVFGLALNLTPCVFPLIPVTMSVFAQQGEGRPSKVLPLAVLYALGIAATFTVVGVIAALAGQSIGVVLQEPLGVLVIVAVLAILMASTFGAFDIQLPSGLVGRLGGRKGHLGAVFMGMVMGAIAAPCVGPFLLALIAFVATTGSVPLGAISFFATGVGLGAPYIVLGTFTGLLNRFPRAGGWLVWTKRLLGMALAGLILWFVHPYIDAEFLWPLVLAVFLFAAIYLGFIEGWSRRPFSKRFWAVRIVAAVAILAAGAVYGYVTYDRPAVEWRPWDPGALREARDEGRPVLLYFGADWCFPCKTWHYRVFTDREVVELSRGFERVKVDLTNLEEGPMKEFARRFDATNPPAVFVIGPDGSRVAEFREPPPADEFLHALRKMDAQRPVTDEDVSRAIERGKEWLYKQSPTDGA